jgi:hypothetical protein
VKSLPEIIEKPIKPPPPKKAQPPPEVIIKAVKKAPPLVQCRYCEEKV